MTSNQTRAYVWVWLANETAPVVCGAIDRTKRVFQREPVVTFTEMGSGVGSP